MGKQEMRRKVYAPLRKAGLEVLEGGTPETSLPAFAVGAAVSCGPETGRRDAYFDYDDPNLIEHANQAWYELAMSSGLFGTDREFLLALPAHRYSGKAASRHRRSVWRRVSLHGSVSWIRLLPATRRAATRCRPISRACGR